MISSKDVLNTAGISRATLNNYIALGILPRPAVRPPEDPSADAPVLGYFPDDTLTRIERVRLLKRQGVSMKDIAHQVSTSAYHEPVLAQDVNLNERRQSAEMRHAPTALESSNSMGQILSIEDIDDPAYMVNYNFEITWFNEAARQNILQFETPPSDSESRNIFKLTDNSESASSDKLGALYSLYVSLGKPRLSKISMLNIVRRADPQRTQMASDCYDHATTVTGRLLVEVPCTLPDKFGEDVDWNVYGIYFREGILIIHTPVEGFNQGLIEFMSRRDLLSRNLLKKQLPVLTPLAVMLADLQGSAKICSELPPNEYFELINEIWSTMDPLFRKHFGTYGKHVGDGMVYYFFPRPDSSHIFNALVCAHEVKQEMRKISNRWQLRKNWLNELHLNIGLHEGTEWLGTFQSGSNVEFAVLGDTINHAARLSDFARFGSIWATKSLVSKLSNEERNCLDFGVTRQGESGREVYIASSYAQLSTLIDLSLDRHEKLREIANLPVTEIRNIHID